MLKLQSYRYCNTHKRDRTTTLHSYKYFHLDNPFFILSRPLFAFTSVAVGATEFGIRIGAGVLWQESTPELS